MNITVYLGSTPGKDAKLMKATQELGQWLGQNGHTLVYGGSKSGLMGILAGATLKAGGEVIGVEAQMFMDEGVEFEGLTKLIVEKDIPDRRKTMINYGEAFIAFPGGLGTLEEISEIMSKKALNQLEGAPCIFYNFNGYYDDLERMLHTMIDMELSTPAKQKGIHFCQNLAEIEGILM
ncbi:TIGR00730 family Rossman fold protein [Ligilactobacillus equi]|uniref:LOG family protein n=1 Tax=Ligilactobacillus equi TaxID=137357 RepID=UPI000469279A|nr:TIGR00730 family Rossman fold protein [Ligilactobacillus equi]